MTPSLPLPKPKRPRERIVLPGGAGYLGRLVTNYFVRQGYEIVVLTRRALPDQEGVRYAAWDGETLGDWAQYFEGAAAIINLAGRTVNCRYNAKNRQEIYDSRLRSTQVVGEAVARCASPPQLWMNSSSATIYRYADDRPMDEATGEIGTGFSVDVCRKWEKTFFDAPAPHTRKVALRSAMVFGRGEGGVFQACENVVKRGLGGTLGSGNQMVSWIHHLDFARSLHWIIEQEELQGPINIASPSPLPNREFMRTFRAMCQQKVGLPAARWMLEIGALFLQTETELLLKSRWVVPGRLRDSGFQFLYPEWSRALEDIVRGADPGALPLSQEA
jgi:uncharacterized protein (TIGR01777 family)